MEGAIVWVRYQPYATLTVDVDWSQVLHHRNLTFSRYWKDFHWTFFYSFKIVTHYIKISTWESLSRIRTLISFYSFFLITTPLFLFHRKKEYLYARSQEHTSKLSLEFLHYDPSVLADNLHFHHGFPAHSSSLADFVRHVTNCIYTHSYVKKFLNVYQFKVWGMRVSYNLRGNRPPISVHPDKSVNSKLFLLMYHKNGNFLFQQIYH